MLLNKIAPSFLSFQASPAKFSSKPINFTSNADVFEPHLHVKKAEFSDEVAPETIKEISLDVVRTLSDEYSAPLATGADGAVYRLDNIENYPNGLALKVSHLESKNPLTGEMQRVNMGFNSETKILKSIHSIGDKSQQYVGKLKLNDGRTVLISTFVQGEEPNIQSRNLNKQSLKSLLDIFYKLDEQGILHRDLKKENIKIDDDNEAGVFDFGAAITFSPLDFKKNQEENHFPSFEVPTNLRNFEDTLLIPYIEELGKENPKEAKELFKDYLELKSDFHAKKAESLKDLSQNPELTQEEAQKLQEMAQYEKTVSQVFKHPSDDVIAIELLKNSITYNTELAYKNEILLLNPLANLTMKANSMIGAKRLEKLTALSLNRPNSLEKKAYLEYRNKETKFRINKIAGWLSGATNWFITCLKVDVDKLPDNMKSIVDFDRNLSDFEIPNIAYNI